MDEPDRAEQPPDTTWTMPSGVPPSAHPGAPAPGTGNPHVGQAHAAGPTIADRLRYQQAPPAPAPYGAPPPAAPYGAPPAAAPYTRAPAAAYAPPPPTAPFAQAPQYGMPMQLPPVRPPAPQYRPVGPVGMTLSGLGVLFCLLSFASLSWLSVHAGPLKAGIDFGTLASGARHDLSDGYALYFAIFAWVFLAIAGLAAIAANLNSESDSLFRAVAIGVAAIACVYTVVVMIKFADETSGSPGVGFGFSSGLDIGPWFALLGFVLIGLGAALNRAARLSGPSPYRYQG